MRRNLKLCLLFVLVCNMASATPPSGYYSGIVGLKDSQLKTKLHEIIQNHSTNSYSGLFQQSFRYTDVRDNGTWWDMYSNVIRYVNNGWSGMNREHSFPKSWWGGSTSVPAYTDLNHLYPSDGDANSAKLHYPLGEVDPNGVTFDNGLVKVGNPVAGQGGGIRYVFEPADEYKGDFARTYFYMVTCYQDLTWKYTYMAANGAYPTLQGWAIELLLKWHRADPVSEKERNRNDEVYRLQYNRNPFIDYPDLVEYIWGQLKGEPYEGADLPPIGDGTLIAPTNKSVVDFGDVIVGRSKKIIVPIRGSLSSDLSLSITGANRSNFSIPVTSVEWETINGSGYDLEVTYKPTAVGENTANLLLYDGGMDGSGFVVEMKGSAHETPVFDRVVATEATNVSSAGFRANWQTPANPSTVDYYVVNVSEYEGGSVSAVSVATDGSETYLDYTDVRSGATYSYTVQSVRFDERSEESNVVYVQPASVSDARSLVPLAIYPIQNGIRFRCKTAHTNVRIVDMLGRTVSVLPEVVNGQCVLLPFGAYILCSDQSPKPVKVLVEY